METIKSKTRKANKKLILEIKKDKKSFFKFTTNRINSAKQQ